MPEQSAPAVVSRTGSRKKLLLGALALAAALVLLLGGQGTYAFWNDTATVTGSGFSSGKLDLTVNGAQGNPTAYAATNLTLTGMVPGESVAVSLTIANAGDADFTWVPTVTTGGALGPALDVKVLLAGNQSGDDTTYPRTETCTGGSALTSGTTATRLNRGAAAQTVCVQVTLPATTDNSFQSAPSGSVSLALLATQVTS